MMKPLIEFIEQFVKLDSQAVFALKEAASIEQYAKNDFILEQGNYCNKVWFLQSGMVRKFHLNNGKEITSWIHTENEVFTSLECYASHSVSEEYIQTCEPVIAIAMSRENSEKLFEFPQFSQFTMELWQSEFANIDKHTKELNARNAKGKYEYLGEIAPEMVKRAKLGHIASMLGISQETLSRIRKN